MPVCRQCGKGFAGAPSRKYCGRVCAARAMRGAGKRTRPKVERIETSAWAAPKKRACHDCGAPTFDYRCPACLTAWRIRHGVPLDGNGQPDEDALWGDGTDLDLPIW